jgi:hypothetical protein
VSAGKSEVLGVAVGGGNIYLCTDSTPRRLVATMIGQGPVEQMSAQAEAHRIARVVNAHDALLAACEAALDFLGTANTGTEQDEVAAQLVAAIVKAEGQ